MKRSLEEREEIVTAVRSKTSVVAWVTDNGVIIFDPSDTKLTVLVGADASFFDGVDETMTKAGVDVPLAIVEGIRGLAATDPEWNGEETFHCQDHDSPGPVHSEDENFYVNLWKRARKQMN